MLHSNGIIIIMEFTPLPNNIDNGIWTKYLH